MRPVVAVVMVGGWLAAVAAQTPPTLEEARKRALEGVKATAAPAQPAGSGPGPGSPAPGVLPPAQEPPPVVPRLPEGISLRPETNAAYEEALRQYFAYFKVGLAHREEVFAWQLFSSRIIFWTVLSLVALGMYFAAMQFRQGLRAPHDGAPTEVTELAASVSGVKLRSPVLGVIILVISFAFFYLYVQFVYPVNTTF